MITIPYLTALNKTKNHARNLFNAFYWLLAAVVKTEVTNQNHAFSHFC